MSAELQRSLVDSKAARLAREADDRRRVIMRVVEAIRRSQPSAVTDVDEGYDRLAKLLAPVQAKIWDPDSRLVFVRPSMPVSVAALVVGCHIAKDEETQILQSNPSEMKLIYVTSQTIGGIQLGSESKKAGMKKKVRKTGRMLAEMITGQPLVPGQQYEEAFADFVKVVINRHLKGVLGRVVCWRLNEIMTEKMIEPPEKWQDMLCSLRGKATNRG